MTNQVVARFPKIYKELDKPYRYKALYGGRGGARSWTVSRKLLIRGTEKKTRILCTRELQKSIKQSVHKLLKDQIENLGLSKFYTVTDTSIKGINGTEFMFMGVKHNTDEIKSTEGVDICWIEEAHSLSEESWDIIDPTIRKEMSEIWITWNPRFKYDYIQQLFVENPPPPGSLVIKANSEDNPYLPDVLIKQRDHMKEVDYEKFLEVWKGQLRQLATGAIFGKQIIEVKQSERLLYIPIQKNCPIDTFFDLGKNDETAIWFMQRVGNEYRFVDYFQGRLEDVDYYTKFIKSIGYVYNEHYLPHDADHNRLGMTRNIKEQFEDGGVKPAVIVDRIGDKTTAIQMARDIFPNCWFHKGRDLDKPADSCEGYLPWLPDDLNTRTKRAEKGFDVLCNYRYKYNEDDKVFQNRPHHDWASNGADAFMCFAQGYNPEDKNDWGGDLNYKSGSIA